FGRQHALGEVVDALEAAAPRRRGHFAGEEQPFHGVLGVAPAPPWPALARAVLEIGGSERAAVLQLAAHLVDEASLLAAKAQQLALALGAAHQSRHLPAPQRMRR